MYLEFSSIDDAPMPVMFSPMSWPMQNSVLSAILRLSCAQPGKTYSEAQKKREPIDNVYTELKLIHEKQIRQWIETTS
jgi:hypothetical protein